MGWLLSFLGLATGGGEAAGGLGVGVTAVTAVTAGGGFGGNAAAGVGFFFVGWLGLVSASAGVAVAVVASCARGGECRAGGIVAGLSYGLVVCLCLSVGFKVFSAMFFYMYENMAEFCLLGGCDECRATEPGRNRRQASRHRRDRMLGG